jgi:linoleate 10R-lipoxygenase
VTLNDNSSYLDLSPLYGGGPSHFVKPVEEMRVFDGTGKIWADTFADGRLLFMPPATAALLILFNRNHNVSTLAHYART